MAPPLLPLRTDLNSAGLLDRGGRPTVRELLAGLKFDPTTGALRLNHERVTLQTAAADRILRRELIQMLGIDEARIFLLRRGFQMGHTDAAFVARSWPALDRGDAFTAGTRLHMFSGIVRVETVHNDFDFARGRFSAEFLWHNSIEAETGDDLPRHSDRPLCWQQLGYASGYASFFFGAPVIYKETACVGQGHRACRVVGRLATGWGEEDPEVILFRNRVLPGAPAVRRPAPAGGPVPEAADALLLAPVLRGLERAARLPLPCLIAGAGSCGQEVATAHLSRLLGGSEAPLRLLGPTCTTEVLRMALAQQRKPRRKETPPPIVLEGIEALPPEVQAELAHELSDGEVQARPVLVASAGLTLHHLATGAILPALWARLAPTALELPDMASRADDLPHLAPLMLARLAASLGLDPPEIAPGAFDGLAALPPAGGYAAFEAVLTALLIEAEPVTEAHVARLVGRIAPLAPMQANGFALDDWIAARFDAGDFALDAHEAQIRQAALARAGGNFSAAARLLGISRAQLAYREKGRESMAAEP